LPSSFAWLDYSALDKRLMLELVDQIREPGTVDELGLGTIRDGFSDYLFPGISTLQSRARYLFFVPWIFGALEEDRHVTSASIGGLSRDLQGQLVRALRAGGEAEGVIGISVGRDLQRPPSEIYWGALGQYGIRQFPGSLGSYFTSIDRWKETHARRQSTRRGDGGELVGVSDPNWHRALPPRPSDYLSRTDFQLSLAEARFLEERLLLTCPGSMLAHCLRTRVESFEFVERPADVPGVDRHLQTVALDSGNFARLVRGAMLLYNLMLAEKRYADASPGVPEGDTDAGRIDAFRLRLDAWARTEVAPRLGDLSAWRTSRSFVITASKLAATSRNAIAFSMQWFDVALANSLKLADDRQARDLVMNREKSVKRLRSRFVNPTALKNWSGEVGTGEMKFRWGNAKILLSDIAAGQHGDSRHD
jgi:hypothetical protein